MCLGCYQLEIMSKEVDTSPGVTIELASTKGQDAAKRLITAEQFYLSDHSA